MRNYLDAYLIAKVSLKHPTLKKMVTFDEETNIKVNPATGEAYIGPYKILLYKIDYSLVH